MFLMRVGARTDGVVRVERQGVDPVAMALELGRHGADARVPHLDDAVAAGAVHHTALLRLLARPTYLHHCCSVRCEDSVACAGPCVPQAHCHVLGGGGQLRKTALLDHVQGLPDCTGHCLRVALEGPHGFAILRVPKHHDLVHPGRGEAAAVGGPGHREHPALVALAGMPGQLCGQVPYPHCAVAGTTGEHLGVRREGRAQYRLGVSGEGGRAPGHRPHSENR
mmetsp:Transcript_44956/g.101124  ORF Transcript_44956/g.101124 Transcript_44956/m.101124 type:complete len:223 (+) Transcript_44956:552-1220(+)